MEVWAAKVDKKKGQPISGNEAFLICFLSFLSEEEREEKSDVRLFILYFGPYLERNIRVASSAATTGTY